jgi:hypothetical protein
MKRRWTTSLAGLLLLPLLGCGSERPAASPETLAALLVGVDPETAEELQSPKKLDRMGGVNLLDMVPYDQRMDILETMWEIEREPEVRTEILDQVAISEGERGTRFIERAAVGPETLQIRDSALYFLTLKPFVPHLNLETIRGILYQKDLPSDLIDSVVVIFQAIDTPEARAVLRQAAQDHPNWEARLSAVAVLGKMGDKESLPTFQSRLQVEDQKDVRRALERAIKTLGGTTTTS